MNFPKEFENKMKNMLKSTYDDFETAMNVNNEIRGIRINTLKISVEDFKKISPFKIEPIPWCNEGFYVIDDEFKLGKHPFYHLGLYYIQEPSAMLPAELLNPIEGDKVADLCAAPGGKTTQLASKLAGSGFILTNDFNPKRTKALAKNVKLAGIKNVLVTYASPSYLALNYTGFFDKVLVDAPCSGEGMFGRDKNAIKNWSPDYVLECQSLQREILKDAVVILKPGGYLVYSTCTFSPEEDEDNISFLIENMGLSLVTDHQFKYMDSNILNGCVRAWPHLVSGHGHFVALLKKENNDINNSDISINKKHLNLKLFDINNISSFYSNFNQFPNGDLFEFEDSIYLIDDISNIHVNSKIEYLGVKLGSFLKSKFIPSQEFAMILNFKNYKLCHNLSSNEIDSIKFLKCETIFADVEDGWCLVCIDGFPAGWAKSINGMLKNYYDVNWRML